MTTHSAEDDRLIARGFVVCEVGGECDICQNDAPQGDLFLYEIDHYCRSCAVKKYHVITTFIGFDTGSGKDVTKSAIMSMEQFVKEEGLCVVCGGAKDLWDGNPDSDPPPCEHCDGKGLEPK